MKARPSFQFYPSDWLRDPGLRSCSLAARGLWIDSISFMHEGEPYGHLTLNGHDIEPATLARMVGSPLRDVRRALVELETAGVFSRTEKGTIFSRCMVRDEALREKRAEGGHLSQNHPDVPKKKDRAKDTIKDTLPPSFNGSIEGSPSSSSSSSSSSSGKKEEEKMTGATPSTPIDPPQGSDEHDALTPLEIHSMWNSIPGVKTCRELGKGIRTRLQSRIKEHPERVWWDGLFAQVRVSNFLCGRTNNSRGPFQASLSWALSPENLEKILAGNYDNPEPVDGQPSPGCEFRVSNGRFNKACGKNRVHGSKYCEQHRSSRSVLPANEVTL